MAPDEDGFVYPIIDGGKCVECGLCEKACAFQKGDTPESAKEVWAAVSGDTDVRQSASGGMFANMRTVSCGHGISASQSSKIWPA